MSVFPLYGKGPVVGGGFLRFNTLKHKSKVPKIVSWIPFHFFPKLLGFLDSSCILYQFHSIIEP